MKKITVLLIVLLLTFGLGAIAQDSTYKEIVGKYKFPAGSVIEEAIVTWDNGVINMSSSAGVSALEKVKGDTFNVVSFSGIAVFKRNEIRRITGVHIDASGYVLDGEKEGLPVNYAVINAIEQLLTDDKLKERGRNTIREGVAARSFYPKITGYIIP